MIMTFIVFIVMIGFLVSIHELGHLIAAKWANVYCYEYSIGMGPLLYKKLGKETQFSIRALPIGGYVAMAGETEEDDPYPDIVVPEGRRLYQVSKWKQAIVYSAGILMNLIVAFVLMYLAVLINGGYNDMSIHPAIVNSVVENTPAYDAGLQVGDEIIGITLSDGTLVDINVSEDMQPYINDQTVTLTLLRDGQTVTTQITPEYNSEQDAYLLGITLPAGKWVEANLLTAIPGSFILVKDTTMQIFQALAGMFSGDGLKNMSGIVGVYQATDQVVEMGIVSVLSFIGMFSLNLAIFNALPLPALDGGRIFLLLITVITGKKINKKLEYGLIMGSFMLLIGLTIIITMKDIINLF